MRAGRASHLGVAAVAIAVASMVLSARPSAQPGASTAVAIDNDDIGGVVAGPNGPEAGVWVVAETTELPTRYAKMVVTDNEGRYVIPDLPLASYDVWVRGYGLVDSPKVRSAPGRPLDLTAVIAPDASAAAQYYPAIFWYSMLQIPDAGQFGGGGDIPEEITQTDWLKQVKNVGCIGCHQLGQASTRTIPKEFGEFASHEEAWMRRVQSGQSGEQMLNQLAGRFGGVPFWYYADWTERIAKGELPPARPERPQGLERNVVITSWEWHTEKQYLHDLIASDRRDPTVNAYGPLYGSPEYSTDMMPILDPKTHQVTTFKMPVRDPDTPEALGPGHAAGAEPLLPSAYWGDEKIWDSRANNHNSMLDRERPGLASGESARHGQPGLLQEGLRPSVGQGVPARPLDPSGDDARSENDEVHLRRHLLRNASSAVRLRRRRHAVAQRHRTRGRLGQHQDVRRDR